MTLTQGDLAAISNLFDEKFKTIDQKFNEIDQRFSEIDQHFNEIDQRFNEIDQHFNEIDQRFLDMESRFDQKLKAVINPIKKQLTRIEVDILENNVLPRLDTIESCYLSTYDRYKEAAPKIDTMEMRLDVLEATVSSHSEQLRHIS